VAKANCTGIDDALTAKFEGAITAVSPLRIVARCKQFGGDPRDFRFATIEELVMASFENAQGERV
jgi:hypothetical protein